MKISIVGDWTYQNYEKLNNEINDIFSSTDFILYNFETTIDFGIGKPKEKAFNFSVNNKSLLFLNDKTICHLANNHINDLGEDNGLRTISYICKDYKGIGIISDIINIKPYVIIKNKKKRLL